MRHHAQFNEQYSFTGAVFYHISQVLSYLSCLAVFRLLIGQNKSNTNRPYSKSQSFENQLKINEHISLIILNSLCHRFNNLGDRFH